MVEHVPEAEAEDDAEEADRAGVDDGNAAEEEAAGRRAGEARPPRRRKPARADEGGGDRGPAAEEGALLKEERQPAAAAIAEDAAKDPGLGQGENGGRAGEHGRGTQPAEVQGTVKYNPVFACASPAGST